MKEVMDLIARSIKVGEGFAAKYGYAAGLMHMVLPEYRSKRVRIVHKKYDDSHLMFDNVRAVVGGMPERVTPPGLYTVLETKTAEPEPYQKRLGAKGKLWEVMMSDTPYELLSSAKFIAAAHGDVLVIGLGLGASTLPVLCKKAVKSVTVIELNKEVIKAVEEPLRKALTKAQNKKLVIINANGRTYEPERGFDTIWIDIWPDVSPSNRTDLKRLKIKYRGFLHADLGTWIGTWIGAWEEERLDMWHSEEQKKPDPLAAVGGDATKSFKKVNGIKL